jgi:murein DD-endopeptidase MepM/ murein hydrolase activator NlpD
MSAGRRAGDRAHGAARKRGVPGALAALVAVGALAAATPGAGWAQGDAGNDLSDQERLRQRDHQVELAMKIDPAAASGEELIAALTTIDQYVRSQIAQVAEAERAQHDAERRLDESRVKLGELQPELSAVTNALRSQAVRLYVQPEQADDTIRLFKAETFGVAEQRRVLGDVVVGDSKELTERMGIVRAKRDQLQAEAASARDEAEARQHQRGDTFARVVAGNDALKRLQTAWDQKLKATAGAGGTDNLGDGAELERTLAEQRAKLPAVAPAPSSNGSFIWPLIGPINDPYGYLSSRGRNHWGIDIGGAKGVPIVAAQGGRVVQAGYSGDYGNLVVIDSPNGIETRYAHMTKISVSVGATVNQGATVGTVGATGDATGPHLHFEVLKNGQHQNPMNYLPPR